jgi:hypothetical protein
MKRQRSIKRGGLCLQHRKERLQPQSHGVDGVLVAAFGFKVVSGLLAHGGLGGTRTGIGSRRVRREGQLVAMP